jgi:hypothetical protein
MSSVWSVFAVRISCFENYYFDTIIIYFILLLPIIGIKEKNSSWDKFDQSTLCACIEILQWNSFVQFIKLKKKEITGEKIS